MPDFQFEQGNNPFYPPSPAFKNGVRSILDDTTHPYATQAYVDAGSGAAACLTMSGGQSINSTTETKATFDTSAFTAVGITVDTANNRLTVLEAGKYQISGLLLWLATVDDKLYQIRLKLNNSSNIYIGFMESNVASGTRYVPLFFCRSFDLAVDDYLEIYGYHNAGTAQNIGNGGDYFDITKVV